MPTLASVTLDLPFTIAGRDFNSRLMVGTGKYASDDVMVRAIEASGAEVVTVAVRRVDLDRKAPGILRSLDPTRFFLLANTAGCYTATDAVRYARLARAAGFNEWVKLEVIADEATLLPDAVAALRHAGAAGVAVIRGVWHAGVRTDDAVSASTAYLTAYDAGGHA